MVDDTIVPCVKSVMTDTITDALNSVGGCCDDFLNEFKTLFGGDALNDMVIKLVQLTANIECSERTFTNLKGVSTKELCGYSIYNSFTFIGPNDDPFSTLLNLAQIPNDQMCNVFAGKAFTNTKGANATIGFGTNNVDTMGICLEPIDTFTQYLSSWKIFSETIDVDDTNVSLSDLFTSGKSIRGNLLLDYATSSTGLLRMGVRATEQVLFALGVASTKDDSAAAHPERRRLHVLKPVDHVAIH
ncbi:Peroxisomal 2 [Phytophthora cinnamomi]|uniref:Peroxisomal 2 n=1 Tax=Phytophthora cinnamomi TaxID=4785 RepID=UPI00355959D9|nr:Peroxisomal 2 [Phytophthora cinnamomi]